MDIECHNRDWLVLTQAEGIGPVTCLQLLETYGSPSLVIQSDKQSLLQSGLSPTSIQALKKPDQRMLDTSQEWLAQSNHHLLTIHDDDYPLLLKSIYAAPPILFLAGDRQALQAIQFAIVGSRNPTRGGRQLAEDFAAELSRQGFSICSGLALGIDYHSHLGCLDAGGITIAVLGNGPDIVYPARHRNMAAQIQENGLLLSEFVPGTKPAPGHFPRRNRIISGLSTGVLVVEAAKKSGSLITAHYALEQGREVFAIPGSIHNPLARGAHSLIKQGAKLVETTDDILEELGSVVTAAIVSTPLSTTSNNDELLLEPEYEVLLEKIGFDAISVDELVKSSGLTAESVSSMLLILELQGLVESRHGGKYCRCPQK